MWNTELWGKRYKISGRIGRLDYLKSQLFMFAIASGLLTLGILTLSKVLIGIFIVYGWIYVWLSFCLIVKRLHDIGLSAWTLLVFILLIFTITINSADGIHTYSLLGLIFGDKASYINSGLSVLFVVGLFTLKGRASDNKYGRTLRGP